MTSYHIFARQFAPATHADSFIHPEEKHETLDQAAGVCEWLNQSSDMHEYTVVTSELIEQAYQEAECWFAENNIKSCTQEEFDAKQMEYIEQFIALKALEAIGK
jgi:hypothetical protein